MTLQAGRIYGGVGRLGAARQGGATPWWLSGGIAAANCVAAYQPKGAASLAASYVNLANPGTYNAAPGVAPTWDAVSGWIFNNVSSQYLSTGVTPASGYSMIVRYSNAIKYTASISLCGYHKLGARFRLDWVDNSSPSYASGGLQNAGAIATSGVMCVAGQIGYFNGYAITPLIPGWTTTADDVVYIGNANGLTRFLTGYIQAFAIYNTPLTAPQVAALTAAMAAL